MGTWGNLLSNMDHWSSNASQINFSFSNAEYVVIFQSNLQRITQAAAGDTKLLFHLLRWSRPKGEYWSIGCFFFLLFLWCFKKRTRQTLWRRHKSRFFGQVQYSSCPFWALHNLSPPIFNYEHPSESTKCAWLWDILG